MKLGVQKLTSRVQTGRQIYKMAKFYRDLGSKLETTLSSFFNYVKSIPYSEDDLTAEVVARPKYLMKNFSSLDCKKKAVLMGAWFEAHGVPWRLLAISERPDKKIHHVFPQAKIEGEWRTADATYPEYNLFEPKPLATKAEELPR